MALFVVPLLGMLAACGTPGRASLAAEQQRLETALEGTPGVLSREADNSLGVDVPLRSSFDRGRATVKPALAKVLDRMAASQRYESTHLLVKAPTDPGHKELALGMRRAVTARDYLIERGLDPSRFSVSAMGRNPTVKIVITASTSP